MRCMKIFCGKHDQRPVRLCVQDDQQRDSSESRPHCIDGPQFGLHNAYMEYAHCTGGFQPFFSVSHLGVDALMKITSE